MHRSFVRTFSFAALIIAGPLAHAQAPVELELVPWAEGLQHVTAIAHCGDDRLFVVRQGGLINVVTDSMTVLPTPFMNIGTRVIFNGERGLLGMAFDPNYSTNGFFYLHYTADLGPDGTTRISRFQVTDADPNIADPDSEVILIELPQPDMIHKGGDLAFGTDGHLYIALGDGGGSSDPNNNGQDPTNLFGTILRIAPEADSTYSIPPDNPFVGDTTGRRAEVWAYGLRNPYRFALDPLTNDLWIGDVGQELWEELNFWPGHVATGPNFGWSCYEGTANFYPERCADTLVLQSPVLTFPHNVNGGTACAIIAGSVYRGVKYPRLEGRMFYTDFCNGDIRMIRSDGLGGWVDSLGLASGFYGFSDLSPGADGELFIANRPLQRIFKIKDRCPLPAPTITGDGPMLTASAADTYEWFLNGEPLPGENGASIIALTNGAYTVQTTYGSGCEGLSEPYFYATTSLREEAHGTVRMMPVPVRDHLLVVRDDDPVGLWTIQVLDLEGRLVHQQNWSTAATQLDFGSAAGGTYMVCVRDAQGIPVSKRLVPVLP